MMIYLFIFLADRLGANQMKAMSIASSSVQNQQTEFINEMRKGHINQINVLENEIQTLRTTLCNSKGITNIITNELQELKKLHAHTTNRLKTILDNQNIDTGIAATTTGTIAAAADVGHDNDDNVKYNDDANTTVVKDAIDSINNKNDEKDGTVLNAVAVTHVSQKRILITPSNDESLLSHPHGKTKKSKLKTTMMNINPTAIAAKCIKCQEEDFGLMIACSMEGCSSRYHTSCMSTSQLEDMEKFKCHLHS